MQIGLRTLSVYNEPSQQVVGSFLCLNWCADDLKQNRRLLVGWLNAGFANAGLGEF
jgi:hypothetical protein